MTEQISPDIEMLARMWVDCDPNRSIDADEIITMHEPEREVPRWHWFIPRAEASLNHIRASGFALVTAS